MTRHVVILTLAAIAAVPVMPARAQDTGIVINGRELTASQARAIQALYRYVPPPGRYWYDTFSGAWGVDGRGTSGFILPGHDLGPLRPDASRGTTGVFINGRELNLPEAAAIQQAFGAVYRGRWWLDGRTGYWGAEGNRMPLGNLHAAMRFQHGGQGGDNFWSTSTGAGNWNGDCGYVSVGGTTVGTGSCR
jgi:hypothetical protein